jgi:5-methylcytosine-specific restriction endonuclease McrA
MPTGIKKSPAKKDKKPVDFYVWLRSGLRKLSRRWSAIYEALDKAKVPYKGDNKRRKWSYVCAECDMLFESKQVAVDHKIPAGALNCKDDIADFVERLFCGPEGLQVLCHECHDCKTLMDKHGYTKEEAKLQKEAIAICKGKVSDVKRFCYDYGYTDAQLSNPDKRRMAVEQILRSVK